jgi:hypothetical protein
MPTFEFTSPEGKKYSVDGPPGATKEQAFQVLQARLAGGQVDSAIAGVPGADPTALAGNRNVGAKPADPSLVDRTLGGLEGAASVITGATTGLAGLVGGALAGVGKAVYDGDFGTQKGVQTAEKYAAEGMDKFTYSPRTVEGQRQVEALGHVMNEALPLTAQTAELQALGKGISAGRGALTDLAGATNATTNAADAALAAAPKAKLSDLLKKPKSTLSGVGSAAASKDAVRVERFERLGIKPTLGQITRDKQQLKFERETAKLEEGKALDDHHAEQNAQMNRQFEQLADAYGPNVSDLRDVGNSVLEAVEAKAAHEKAGYTTLYNEADAAGEMAAPVDVTNLVTFVKTNKGKDKLAPIISMIESELQQNSTPLGGGLDKLTLTPTSKRFTMSLRASEDLRQAINETMEPGTPNSVWGKKAIRLIDAATEDKGGPMYRQARRAYENYQKQFGDRSVIKKLLATKPGTRDRAVAIEDVFKHTILDPRGKDDIAHVFRVLEAHPANADPAIVAAGRQAAGNLRAALVDHIRDKMFSNAGANTLGDVVGSQAKIKNVVTDLDARGKLKAVFGAEGADYLRDLRDAAIDIYTTPEGSVNPTNNAGPIVAALSKLEQYAKPIPGAKQVAHGAAELARSRAISKRVEQALNPKAPNSSPFTSPQKRPSGATVH